MAAGEGSELIIDLGSGFFECFLDGLGDALPVGLILLAGKGQKLRSGLEGIIGALRVLIDERGSSGFHRLLNGGCGVCIAESLYFLCSGVELGRLSVGSGYGL